MKYEKKELIKREKKNQVSMSEPCKPELNFQTHSSLNS